MREGASAETEAVRLALTRHQRRREQGIPTLGILIGPEEAAVAAWQGWVSSLGWPPAVIERWPDGDDPIISTGTALYVGGTSAEDPRNRNQQLSHAVVRLSRLLTTTGPLAAGAAWAVNVRREDATTFLRDNAHSRAGAMFIEGMVELTRPPSPERTPSAGVEGEGAFITRIGVSPATVERFRAAATACGQAAEAPAAWNEAHDRARSAAERFLFELLNDLPDTAGLFELNTRLGFCFGPMPAEVDLFSSTLGLAVEIDGYHHFRDPENYRRDRRKDVLLQKQGYLVLRFLAEDAVARLEEILEEIRAAVAFRRAIR